MITVGDLVGAGPFLASRSQKLLEPPTRWWERCSFHPIDFRFVVLRIPNHVSLDFVFIRKIKAASTPVCNFVLEHDLPGIDVGYVRVFKDIRCSVSFS